MPMYYIYTNSCAWYAINKVPLIQCLWITQICIPKSPWDSEEKKWSHFIWLQQFFGVFIQSRELPVNINITWMNTNTLGFSTAWDSFHWKTQNIYPINSCEYFAVLLKRNSLFGECGLYFDSSEMRNFLLTLSLPF